MIQSNYMTAGKKSRNRLSVFLGMLLICAVCSSSCSYRKIMINDVVDMAETAMDRFENEYTDLKLLETAAPAALVNLEGLLANDPRNERMLILLSKLYFNYTYALKETDWEQLLLDASNGKVRDAVASKLKVEISRYYEKGISYALDALALRYPAIRKQLRGVKTADPVIRGMGPADTAALFWYAMNLSAYININRDSVRAVSKLHLAVAAMKRVLKLDPDYYYGCAHLDLMTIYASVPPILGGDPDRAIYHYREQKRQVGDDFLLLELHYARYYLYQQQEKDAYINTLRKIIRRAEIGAGRFALLNKVAATRAAVYLRAADRLFE